MSSERHFVKSGRKTKGFVWVDTAGKWWFAFGTPSQAGGYIAFGCANLEAGIAAIENPIYNK